VTVFISHSFADKAQFENVTAWLDRDGVPYWNPTESRVRIGMVTAALRSAGYR
jgi:hypothetical protein